MRRWVADILICLQATTKLEVQKDSGKILSHIETWHNKSVSPVSFGWIAVTRYL